MHSRNLAFLWSLLSKCSQPSPVINSAPSLRLTLRLHGLQPTRLLCPWDALGKDTGVGCRGLLQGILPTQAMNPSLLHLLHCRQVLYNSPWGNNIDSLFAPHSNVSLNILDLTEAEDIKKRWQEYTELCTQKALMTRVTTMACSLTQSQTSWSVKSSGPQEALLLGLLGLLR